jgi:hypothetical protein
MRSFQLMTVQLHRTKAISISFLLTALSMFPFAIAMASSTVGYGSRAGMEVTIRSVSGLDTAHAAIRTEHTRENAIAFCRDYVQNVTEDCIRREFATPLKDVVTANCPNGEFTDFYGNRYRLLGLSRKTDISKYVIMNVDSHEIADGTMASGYPTNIDIFTALCPSRLASLNNDQAANYTFDDCMTKDYQNRDLKYYSFCVSQLRSALNRLKTEENYKAGISYYHNDRHGIAELNGIITQRQELDTRFGRMDDLLKSKQADEARVAANLRTSSMLERMKADAETKGYKCISIRDFMLDKKMLAKNNEKIAMAGMFFRFKETAQYLFDVKAIGEKPVILPSTLEYAVPLLLDDADRRFREDLFDNFKPNAVNTILGGIVQTPSFVMVMGTVGICTSKNEFGAETKIQCLDVDDGSVIPSED